MTAPKNSANEKVLTNLNTKASKATDQDIRLCQRLHRRVTEDISLSAKTSQETLHGLFTY